MNKNTKRLALSGMLIALGVIGGAWSIPIGISKCAPIQHMINILAATTLGPLYSVIIAFIISCLRLIMGTGTLLAFPGSMVGALLAGILFSLSNKLLPKNKALMINTVSAILGELIGTSVLGGLLAYPVAIYLMGREAALFTYLIPFFISSLGGTIIGTIIYLTLRKTKTLERFGV